MHNERRNPLADPRPVKMGVLFVSERAQEVLSQRELLAALSRHGRSDWADVDDELWAHNERALSNGGPLSSTHRAESGTTFYVITDALRQETVVLVA